MVCISSKFFYVVEEPSSSHIMVVAAELYCSSFDAFVGFDDQRKKWRQKLALPCCWVIYWLLTACIGISKPPT